jgi:hypothetical protein
MVQTCPSARRSSEFQLLAESPPAFARNIGGRLPLGYPKVR